MSEISTAAELVKLQDKVILLERTLPYFLIVSERYQITLPEGLKKKGNGFQSHYIFLSAVILYPNCSKLLLLGVKTAAVVAHTICIEKKEIRHIPFRQITALEI